jgi:hypothetical protein
MDSLLIGPSCFLHTIRQTIVLVAQAFHVVYTRGLTGSLQAMAYTVKPTVRFYHLFGTSMGSTILLPCHSWLWFFPQGCYRSLQFPVAIYTTDRVYQS